MRRMTMTGLCLALAAPIAACAPADDAGDASFVHQAVQTMLCRKPRGAAELAALTEIVTAHGRGALIDVLAEEPDYVECWLPILADAMQIQRDGDFKQQRACVDTPTYLAGCSTCVTEATALADHIRDAMPRTPFGSEWNLNDALRAAILVDDLHVAWRPWLFALAGRPQVLGKSNLSAIRDNYLATAFNVNTECIGCHSTSYSKTEIYPDADYPEDIALEYSENTWDRTANPGFDLHGSAFSRPSAGFATWSYRYDTNCAGCHGYDGESWPWVNLSLCTSPTGGSAQAPLPLRERVPMLSRDAIKSQIMNGGGCMPAITDLDGDGVTAAAGDADEEQIAGDLADFLRLELGGWQEVERFLKAAQFKDAAATTGPWGLSEGACGFTWTEDLVTDGDAHWFGGRSFTYTDAANITVVLKNGLDALPQESAWAPVDAPADPYLPGTADSRASVALLIATNIADDLLEEISGGRGTLSHGLSRTEAQSEILRGIISQMVVTTGTGRVTLSLRSALKQAMLSDLYNRRAPSETTLTDSAYKFDMYVNPWAATADGVTSTDGDNLNGQGDLVHRRSPNEILRSLSKDLGWRAPAVYPGTGSSFPTRELMTQIGRYESTTRPGTTTWQFSSLLLWEAGLSEGTTTVGDEGPCARPIPGDDYIDELVQGAFVAPTVPTLGDLVRALKDRMIQEPVLDAASGEEALIGSLLDAGLATPNALAQPANTWTQPAVKAALRGYCGVLALSPDYLLANLPTVTVAPAPPPFQVCLAGELCAQADLEGHYCDTLTGLGLSCP